MELCDHISTAMARTFSDLRCIDLPDGTVRVSYPLTGAGDEPIDLWVSARNGRLHVSDGGETLMELEALGVNPKRGRAAEFIGSRLASSLVRRRGYELMTEARPEDMAASLHALVNVVKDVSSLYNSARPRVPRTVNSRVAATLKRAEIQFEPRFKIQGRQNLERRFDFRTSHGREALIRTLSTDSDSAAQRAGELLAFHALDLRSRYPDRFRFLFVYDDDRLTWPEGVYRELESHEVLAIPASDEPALLEGVAA